MDRSSSGNKSTNSLFVATESGIYASLALFPNSERNGGVHGLDEVMRELEEELHIDIAYDPKDEIAVIQSTVGSVTTFFGVPLSEEIRADKPEEAVREKIRKVVGVGRRVKKIRDPEIPGRVDHNLCGDRDGGRTEELVRHEASRMDCQRMVRDRPDSGRVKKRTRIQRRKRKMNEPSIKDIILLVITVLALFLALSGAEMLTNLDPHPLAGCICLALGATWITLICFVNSEAGKEFLEDVRCLK